jgi:hypothetical protein
MSIEKLLSIASEPLAPDSVEGLAGRPPSKRLEELHKLLSVRNGFYAFEGALHVLPWVAEPSQHMSIQRWNEESLWRGWYQGQVDNLLFFAEDAFGGQFAIQGDQIVSFDPESGDVNVFASSIEDWAGKLLLNYDELTGWSAARSWQLVYGAIPVGQRLLPKTAFILGGAYSQENLFAADAVKGMQYRAELWLQIRDLPDGAQVRLNSFPVQ